MRQHQAEYSLGGRFFGSALGLAKMNDGLLKESIL